MFAISDSDDEEEEGEDKPPSPGHESPSTSPHKRKGNAEMGNILFNNEITKC
jgi:hypothetical protein